MTLFNDADKENAAALLKEIEALPGVQKLRYKPQVQAEEVGDKIVAMFEEKKLVPTADGCRRKTRLEEASRHRFRQSATRRA